MVIRGLFMNWGRKMTRVLFVSFMAFVVQGCAAGIGTAFMATGAGVAVGAGVDHTLSGIAYKTFSVSTNELRFATLKTLHRMDISVIRDEDTPDHHAIDGKASDRTIEIELEPLTRRTTRMRVVANMGGLFFKDAATATEIIVQTAQTLDAQIAQRP
jgi:hypothetical protein